MESSELTDYLRRRVVGLLHAHQVAQGDRLPSIREVSTRLDADHRAVAEAYRVLEAEGLVEIRRASGVYVRGREEEVPGVEELVASWLAEVLEGAWSQRMGRGEAGRLLGKCGTRAVRCACVESVRDSMVAVAAELEDDFDLVVERVYLEAEAEGRAAAVEAIGGADLVVTLHFHAVEVRELAERSGTPLVVVRVHPELARRIDAILAAGPVIGVVSDPRMVGRMQSYFAVTAHRDAVKAVLSSEVGSLEELKGRGRRVLATRAARRDLGAEDYHILPAPPTLIAPTSAREILERVARLSLADDLVVT